MAAEDPDLMQRDNSYYPYVAISCTIWLVNYKYVSPFFSEMCFSGYKALPRNKQIEWHTRVNSTIHAVLASILCIYNLLYDEDSSKDPIWANSPRIKNTCAIVVGYMLSDTIIMLVYYKAVGDTFAIFHHCSSMCAFYYVMTYSCLCWFANFRIIAELSTPFVNQRWYFDVLGVPKSSLRVVANSLAMALMFLLFRIFVIPPYWHKVWSVYGTPAFLRLGGIWLVLVASSGLLEAFNMYWFYKIFHGAKKIVNSILSNPNSNEKQKDKSSSANENSANTQNQKKTF